MTRVQVSMSQESRIKVAVLRDRAKMLRESRAFFDTRGLIEVDCPMLSPTACVDEHIDLIPGYFAGSTPCYLHSSPEYGMKRLLSDGIGDIYQISHVFRDGEVGSRHHPEFTMTEWYRIGFNFQEMIDETIDYIRLFLGDHTVEQLTYHEAFEKYLGIDPFKAKDRELKAHLSDETYFAHDRNQLLNLILGIHIEPKLGQDGLTVITHYPASQAALAKKEGDESLRFEVYFRGVELANGYDELCDATEQRERLHESNQARLVLEKEELPIDEAFLNALEKGIPDCCGVAVGFDRLMMLRHGVKEIRNVLPIAPFSV